MGGERRDAGRSLRKCALGLTVSGGGCARPLPQTVRQACSSLAAHMKSFDPALQHDEARLQRERVVGAAENAPSEPHQPAGADVVHAECGQILGVLFCEPFGSRMSPSKSFPENRAKSLSGKESRLP